MSYIEVVKDKNFVKLWSSQIMSLTAQNLVNFALVIRIFEITQNGRFANISVALLILSFGIPAILFSSLAGVYVDHWDRKRVLVVSNFLRTILVLGFLFFEHNLLLVLATTFIISTATQFFAPAEAASIPIVSKADNLVKANALFVTTFYATFIIGYSASAPVINLLGSQAPYYLASAFFGLATLLALFLPSLGGRKSKNVSFAKLWKLTQTDLKTGRKLVFSDPNLRFPILQLMFVQGVISVILTLAPALSLALFRQPLQVASLYLVLPASFGMLVGVAVVGYLSKRVQKTILVKTGLVIAGAGLILFGLTGQLYRIVNNHPLATPYQVEHIVAVILFILGITVSVISVSAQTLLHEMSEEKMRGTIFGVLYTMINVAATVPVLFAGVLADLLSVTKVIIIVGVFVWLFAFTQAANLPERVLTLKRN
ncbi:MAG: MFS transporter [Candidatus Saccharimonadia bacterium]